MAKDELIDVREVLRGYSRTLLHEFEEHERQYTQAKDRGAPRESGIRQFLADRLPARYGVGEGYVVDRSAALSRQSDAVIFERALMPRIELKDEERIRLLFPCELVYAVVEVKSRLTEEALGDAIAKIASFKVLQRPDHDTVAMPGFVSRAAHRRNPPLGAVVAHAYGEDLNKADSKLRRIQEMFEAVPRDQQPDAVLVLGEDCYLRSRAASPPVIDLSGGTFTHLKGLNDNALGFFLFTLTTLLSGIDLGKPNLMPYANLLLQS
jgi:hypothetical protein